MTIKTILALWAMALPASATSDVALTLGLGTHEARTGKPFELTLDLENPTDDLLVGVDVLFELLDASGADATAELTVPAPVVTGIGALDGTASLAPGAQASATWALIPGHALAAGVYELQVTVSATLEGDALVRELPASLRVLPSPELEAELFLPARVFGDWSTTPSLFEPAEPFPVGLLLRNVGAGATVGQALDSAGPRFAPDPLGAATGAAAVELELDGAVLPAGFGLDASQLGDLDPGEDRHLLWTALPFARADVLGLDLGLVRGGALEGPFLELPESLTPFELVHAAHVFETLAGPLDDGKVDWLVDDPAIAAPTDPLTGGPMEAFPDLVRMSAGADLPLVPVTTPTLGRAPTFANLVTSVEFPAAAAGWHVVRIDAPGGAYFDLAQVVRTAKALHLPGLTVGGPAGVSRVWVTERPLDVTADGIPDVTRRIVHVVDYVAAPGNVRYDLVHLPSAAEALSADLELLAASAGGTQTLTLDAGPDHAASNYIVLGSLTGTAPGFPLDGVSIPLNIDPYLLLTLTNPGGTTMVGGLGVLDALGRATAQVNVPAGFPAGVGLTAHHAFVAFPAAVFPLTFASNAVPLFVLP